MSGGGVVFVCTEATESGAGAEKAPHAKINSDKVFMELALTLPLSIRQQKKVHET